MFFDSSVGVAFSFFLFFEFAVSACRFVSSKVSFFKVWRSFIFSDVLVKVQSAVHQIEVLSTFFKQSPLESEFENGVEAVLKLKAEVHNIQPVKQVIHNKSKELLECGFQSNFFHRLKFFTLIRGNEHRVS